MLFFGIWRGNGKESGRGGKREEGEGKGRRAYENNVILEVIKA